MSLISQKRIVPNLQCCIIEITLACNLKCIHCGSFAGKCRKNELTKEEIFKLVDDLKKIECELITIMGGEFILKKDWFDICKYIRKQNIELVIISNGTLITKKSLDQLKSLSLYSMVYSLDGVKKGHEKIRGKGTFEKVEDSIKLTIDSGIPLGIITTLNKLNISDLPELREFLYKFKNGIRWQIQTASYGGSLDDTMLIDETDFLYICKFIEKCQKEKRYDPYELLILGADDIGYNQNCISPYITSDYDWHGCKAGINVLGIQSDGGVKGCLSLSDDFIEGNIRDKSIVDIWNDKNSFRYTRNFQLSDIGENCKDCVFAKKCKGGCTEISFNRTGKVANSPFCLHRMESKKYK